MPDNSNKPNDHRHLCAASQFTGCGDIDVKHATQNPRICIVDWVDGWRPDTNHPDGCFKTEKFSSVRPDGHSPFGRCSNTACEYCEATFAPRDVSGATSAVFHKVTKYVATKGADDFDFELESPGDALDDAIAYARHNFGGGDIVVKKVG